MATIVAAPGPTPTHAIVPGAPRSGTVVKPHFEVKILGDSWAEISHLTVETRSCNVMGVFQAHASFSEAGETSAGGKVKPGSKLDKLMQLQFNAAGLPSRVPVSIVVGYDNDPQLGPRPTFNGFVDIVSADRREDVVTISGRDKSSIFWESSLFGQFRNQSVALTIRDIAVRHGFDYFIVDNGTQIGEVYDYDTIGTALLSTQGVDEWTFLTQCANADGHAVFMSVENGVDTLNYVPIEHYNDIATFDWGDNIDELMLTKYYSLNSGRIGVEVASSHLKRKESILATAGAARSGGGDALIYRKYLPPNTAPDDAGRYAELWALFLTQLEFTAEIHTIGSPTQSVKNRLRLTGGSPSFDRDYRVIRVNWTMGMDVGWRAEILAVAAPTPDALRVIRRRGKRNLGQR